MRLSNIPSEFQKDLIVWKLYVSTLLISYSLLVSEGLNSVETSCQSHELGGFV